MLSNIRFQNIYFIYFSIIPVYLCVILSVGLFDFSADGACRHVGARLYELERFREEQKSVTDGPSQWVRRARPSDKAAPVQDLDIHSARYVQGHILKVNIHTILGSTVLS